MSLISKLAVLFSARELVRNNTWLQEIRALPKDERVTLTMDYLSYQLACVSAAIKDGNYDLHFDTKAYIEWVNEEVMV